MVIVIVVVLDKQAQDRVGGDCKGREVACEWLEGQSGLGGKIGEGRSCTVRQGIAVMQAW